MIDFLKFMADLNLDPEPYENEPWFKAKAEAKAEAKAKAKAKAEAKAEAEAVVSSFNITDEKMTWFITDACDCSAEAGFCCGHDYGYREGFKDALKHVRMLLELSK